MKYLSSKENLFAFKDLDVIYQMAILVTRKGEMILYIFITKKAYL